MPTVVLIEGDTLKEKKQATVDVGSLEEFKAAVAKVAKVSIDMFDLLVFNMDFGEWCEPDDFDSLGDKVKVKLVAKQHGTNEDNAFAMDPESFQKFQAPK
jgi:hypothetical protein